jgi:hypothetical protein
MFYTVCVIKKGGRHIFFYENKSRILPPLRIQPPLTIERSCCFSFVFQNFVVSISLNFFRRVESSTGTRGHTRNSPRENAINVNWKSLIQQPASRRVCQPTRERVCAVVQLDLLGLFVRHSRVKIRVQINRHPRDGQHTAPHLMKKTPIQQHIAFSYVLFPFFIFFFVAIFFCTQPLIFSCSWIFDVRHAELSRPTSPDSTSKLGQSAI